MKTSDYIVKFFEEQNIKDVFMVTGGGCMHIANSIGHSNKIKYWCTHHEQSAAFAAEAYAKVKNQPAVVITTSGPGATNTVTGILDCYLDSTPAIFIFGQSKRSQTVLNSGVSELRQFGVAEAKIVPIVSPITKFAAEVNEPRKIRYYLEAAFFAAKHGRPGPAVLSIPLDVQSSNINEYDLERFLPNEEEYQEFYPCSNDVDYICKELKKARRPVIICGHGVRLSRAEAFLGEFAEKNNIPVVMSYMGIDVLPDDHLCNIGRIGTKGTRAGNFTVQNSDLILSIGSRLSVSSVGHEYNLFARNARVIVVDVDEAEHKKKTIKISRFIKADANAILNELLKKCDDIDADNKEWLEKCLEWKKKYPVVLPQYDNDTAGINFYKFVDILNEHSADNTIFVADAGSAFFVASQALKIRQQQRYITTGGTATMGFSVPASIGCSAASDNAPIIVITGEGSFMQNLQEIESIKLHNLRIKIFVMCNGGYFSIMNHQKRFFSSFYVGSNDESGVSFTNLQKLSDAFEISYYHLYSVNQSLDEIQDILSQDGPALIEVDVDRNMEIIPANTYMVKPNGVLVSKPLEDMYPFLDREEFRNNMIVPTVNE